MTRNDRTLTKALVKIPRKHMLAAEFLRRGDLLKGIEHLEELTNWVDVARRRAKELANGSR